MNDNVYPLDGQPFALTTPVRQKEEREKLIKETIDQLPLLKQVIKRLDKQIDSLDKLSSITVSIDDDPAVHQRVFHANKLAKGVLENERRFILSRIEQASTR